MNLVFFIVMVKLSKIFSTCFSSVVENFRHCFLTACELALEMRFTGLIQMIIRIFSRSIFKRSVYNLIKMFIRMFSKRIFLGKTTDRPISFYKPSPIEGGEWGKCLNK